MKAPHAPFLVLSCLLLVEPALAGDRHASRCQSRGHYRHGQEQGTELWGSKPSWGPISATLNEGLRLENGRLAASSDPAGLVLQARSGFGPTEVAICGAEPSDDGQMTWYRIEAWNPVMERWENPCAAKTGSEPRALAVDGVWDTTGTRHDAAGQFTFACETGAIAKCTEWGYRPWATHGGQSLRELHQACTRLARADYCGNGRSHTTDGNLVDIYDALGLLQPARATTSSFEAGWGPDGATCIHQTRSGDPVDTVLRECPGRFQVGAVQDLGGGDRCAVHRAGSANPAPLIRNRLYRK